MLLGQGVMINWSDVAPEHRAAYYEWHSREHMVGRVAIAGFQRGRRYIAVNAQRDFLVLYEVDDLSVLTGADYLAKANAPSALTQRTTPFVKNSVRGIARVEEVARHRHRRLRAHIALRSRGRRGGQAANVTSPTTYCRGLPPYRKSSALHLLVADPSASTIVPVERKGRPTIIPNWIVVLEGISIAALDSACDAHLAQESLRAHGCADTAERETYSLQLMVTKPRAAHA